MDLIGVDIGGTKISISLGDQTGKLFASKQIPTASLEGAKKGLPKLVKLIEDLTCEQGLHLKEIRAVGLAVPGPVSIKTGHLLTPPNMPGWVNVPIVHDLSEQLRAPVFMDNDANAGALAEWMFGKRENVESLIYLTMSTGMGAGIVLYGQVIQGGSDTAGEVGHCILDPKGPQCLCGQRGCFEAFCGGASVARILREEVKKNRAPLILKAANGKVENVDMKCLFAAIKQNDPFALAFWKEYMERLSQGIGMIIQFFNPDVLILGTIALHHADLVMPPLRKALPRYVWKAPLEHCSIEPTLLGKDLGALSALSVAMRGLRIV